MTSLIEQAKQKAAYQAVDEHVLPTHTVIGVGSGSTVVHVVARLLERDPALNAKTVFIPTSFQSRGLLLDGGLTVGDVEQYVFLLFFSHLFQIGRASCRERVL